MNFETSHTEKQDLSEKIRKDFEAANEARDYTIYTRLMDAALEAKAKSIFPYINAEEGDVVVDAGSGTGALAEMAAQEFRGAHVYALDISHELHDRAEPNKALTKLVFGDASQKNFPDNSVKVKIFSTSGHEIESFGGTGRMKEAVKNTFLELSPEGRVVVRDFAKPSSHEPIYMEIISKVGLESVPENAPADAIDYNLLSARALFERFHREFRGGNAFSYELVSIDGREYIKIDPEWAHEFYLRKDYTANWRQEIKEKYTYWSPEEAEAVLKENGYVNIRIIPDTNEFILKNRLEGKIGLHTMKDGKLVAIPFPPTHMVVIGEKPVEGASEEPTSSKFPEGIDYEKLLNAVKIEQESAIAKVGEKTFELESPTPVVGTKKMAFFLKDGVGILKIVRPDTKNHHNAFKSLFQTIARENILEEYGVPRAKIIDKDPEGPPFRYLVQEAIRGTSAADLVLRGELTERDIQQIASIINRFEKGKLWQLDTNPHNWLKVTGENGETSLVYVDGKVYRYDEEWEFKRVGLLQWLYPHYIQEGHPLSASIPKDTDFEELKTAWKEGGPVIDMWKKYLDSSVAPI